MRNKKNEIHVLRITYIMEWRSIPNYTNYKIYENGVVVNSTNEYELKPFRGKICICKNGIAKVFSVNVLLRQLFPDLIEGEEWKVITEVPTYSISNFGRVKNTITFLILKNKCDHHGYMYIRLSNGSREECLTFKIHRLVAMYFVENTHGKNVVDHIDGDVKNNHFSNLRWATIQENIQNTRKQTKPTSSQYKGVVLNIRNNKWKAQIRHNNESHFLGVFDSETDAARAYDKKARELFGEYACTNFSQVL